MIGAQLIQFPLWGGIDESTDDARTPPNRMREALNCVFPSVGIVSKRHGLDPVSMLDSSGVTVGSVKKLAAYGNELLATDGQYLYSRSPSAGRLERVGRASPCVVSTSVFSADETFTGEIVDCGNYRAYAWESASAGSNFAHIVRVIDKTTGAPVMNFSQLTSAFVLTNLPAFGLRLTASGKYIIAIYQTTTDIVGRYFDTTTRTWSAPQTILAGTTSYPFDICPVDVVANNPDVLVVVNNTATAKVRVARFNQTLALQAGFTDVATALPAAANVTIRATVGETAWVGWSYVTGGNALLRVANHNPSTMVQTQAPWTLNTTASTFPYVLGFERVDATHSLIAYALINSTATLGWSVVSSTGVSLQSFTGAPNWALVSKPFKGPTGQIYAVCMYTVPYQYTQCLLELSQNTSLAPETPPLPMATISPRSSLTQGQLAPILLLASQAANISVVGDSSQTQFTIPVFDSSSTGVSAMQSATFDFQHPALGQSATIGSSIVLTGGTPMSYDGQRPVEQSFVHAPVTAAGAITPGTNLFPRIYKYVAIYARENAKGEIVRSPPNTYAPTTVDITAGTAGATNQAAITVNILRVTHAQDVPSATLPGTPVRIEIYRTHWDGAAMSTVYYRCGVINNSLFGSTVTFHDDGSNGITEANILSVSPALYTTGGALESDTPPGLRFLCAHNDRLFGIGADGHTVWYTTPYVLGEQPRWNDALSLDLADGDGDLTALASLDGRLYAFTQQNAYVIAGDGPGDTGAGASFSTPEKLPFGLGCVDARGLDVVQDGILASTLRGLYIFGRDGMAKWIGNRVQRTMASFPFVTSIVHLPTDGVIRITAKTSDTLGSTGVVMHWDYRQDCWAKWDVNSPVQFSLTGFVSAVAVNGVYYAAATFGALSAILVENAATWIDNNGSGWVTLRATSPWIGIADFQGYQRVAKIQLLAQYVTAHGLHLFTMRDYSSTLDPQHDFTAATLADLAVVSDSEQVRISPAVQKCQSMSVQIQDNAGEFGEGFGESGEALRIRGLLFKVRGKRGEWKQLADVQKG